MIKIIVLRMAIIMITNVILKPITVLQIRVILSTSETAIILFSKSCLITIISITTVVHFKYGPTKIVMVFVSLILHPST